MKRYIPLFLALLSFASAKISAQHTGPEDQMSCIGDQAIFTVEHSFDFVTFEWQESAGPSPSGFATISDIEPYSGTATNELTVNTAAVNPPGSGLYRYYRCRMYSNVYEDWFFSDTAFLEINIPPTVDFTTANPCEGQTMQFESLVGTGAGPFKYFWSFGDAPTSVSVYPNPSHLYENAGTYEVSLTVIDMKGCTRTAQKQVIVYGIPEFRITGKEVVCSNEIEVEYEVSYDGILDGDTVLYSWDVSGFGTIQDPTLESVLINWNAVANPTQSSIVITATIQPSGCVTQVSKEVLITSYVAPPPAEKIFRKPYESSLLIYKGPEVNSYQWGYTDNQGRAFPVPGATRFYHDFTEIRADYLYWVETSYDSRINCITRSYLEAPYKDDPGFGSGDASFRIYPNPASGWLTVSFNPDTEPEQVAIYNLMMQKVYESEGINRNSNEMTIGLESFRPGIYIIRIAGETGMNNYRIFTIEK